jgi:hypothetical protein
MRAFVIFTPLQIIRTIESNIMRVAGHVACAGRMRKAQDCNIFAVNPERKMTI